MTIKDNAVYPFQLESSNLRGRLVKLGPSVNEIIDKHDYPAVIETLTVEVATLAVLLASNLKYEGIFTLQIQGEGAVSLVMADITSEGDLRACAHYDEDKMQEDTEGLALLGKSYMSFTVDQGENTERYQGIVELKGDSLKESAQYYFQQSEQIPTGIQMSVRKTSKGWRSGAILIQKMPDEDKVPGQDLPTGNIREDDWRRAMILMGSCTDDELLSPDLHAHDLLIRLFHEEGVRVYDPQQIEHQCRCSRERVENVINMIASGDGEELEDYKKDGVITMTCEFCSRKFTFDEKQIQDTLK